MAIVWAGQTITSKAQLTALLAKSGVSYQQWAANHPAAAQQLGGGGTAPKPAPSPAAAAGAGPVTNAPIPGVAAYGMEMSRAQNAYDNAVAYTKGNLASNLATLGFNADGSVNGQNAYGAYQQNRRAAGQAAEQAAGNSVNRGLGAMGGLADQQHNEATFQAGAGMSGILGQAAQQNFQANADVQSAGQTLQERLAQAQLVAAQQSIADRNFTQAAQPAGTPGAPKPAAGGFQWGGQTITNKAQLTAILAKSGVSYATWAKNHPDAAAKL